MTPRPARWPGASTRCPATRRTASSGATLPPLLTVKRPLNPPALTASKEALEQGGALYRSYCTRCHGHATVAGGVVTDLRYSAMLGSPEAYRAVVLDGVLMRNGMISFSDFLEAGRRGGDSRLRDRAGAARAEAVESVNPQVLVELGDAEA